MSFPSAYEEFIFYSRYAKLLPSGRRETWTEAVNRYLDFLLDGVNGVDRAELFTAIHEFKVMPSMRALMTAGPAAKRDNVCIYNCAYLEIDSPKRLAEVLYILMSGTGVGFSCEQEVISKLPTVPAQINSSQVVHVVADSKMGWAVAFQLLLESLWQGGVPHFDYSLIRPAGAPLKTMGGRASGPEPLKKLFGFTKALFLKALGRQLTSKQVHELVCNIAEIVVVGGVRRSALISLSDLNDTQMRDAKHGQWWNDAPYLGLANNSATYNSQPSAEVFRAEWRALELSNSGERGIFNRHACSQKVAANGRRSPNHRWGTNPCSEIILRPCQFCNLSEVVIRSEDTEVDVAYKVRLATILGTLQSRFCNFPFLDPIWADNCKEERLLGVSLTGICDNRMFSVPSADLVLCLQNLRSIAVRINRHFAQLLQIPPSTAITCVKPSGTVSQLVDCASGIHPRFARHYIRTVRIDKKDPLYLFLRDKGVPVEDDVNRPDSTAVFSFPKSAPAFTQTRDDIDCFRQLELWLLYYEHWCEHKPSSTVYVAPNEWDRLGSEIWKNFNKIGGIAFLPKDNGTYVQAPYQEVSALKFKEIPPLPLIDWNDLAKYDRAAQGYVERGRFVMACTGDGCEIVDIL